MNSLKQLTPDLFSSQKVLIFLLVVGGLLRLSGIFWSLPTELYGATYHPDEPKIINAAFEFPAHVVENRDLRYPTAVHYTLGLLTWPLKQLPEPTNYQAIYLTGRLISVLLGTATIWITYQLGRTLCDDRTGLLAAFFITFTMLHSANSAWATTDVATSFWLVLFLWLMFKAITADSLKLAAGAGCALGLLIGSKYTGGIALLPLFVMIIYSERQKRPQSGWLTVFGRFFINKHIWTIGLVSLIVFFLTTPGILLYPQALIDSIRFENERIASYRLPFYAPAIYQDQLSDLADSIGWPLTTAALLGFFSPFNQRRVFTWSLVVMLLWFSFYFGESMAHRYFILVMPILALLAADFFRFALVPNKRFIHWFALFALAVVALYSVYYTTAATISRYPETRLAAVRYIEETVPAGATIGIAYVAPKYGWQTHAWRYPVIDFDRYTYQDFLADPEYIVMSSYDFDPIRRTLQSGVLTADYTLPESEHKYWYRSTPPPPEIFRFNEAVLHGTDNRYRLLETIAPHNYTYIDFPSPTIEIYIRQDIVTQ